MNWFDNISTDCDQPVPPVRLVQGLWQHQLHPFADPVLCRLVIDLAEPRVVAAQVIEHGMAEDLGSSALEDLTQTLASRGVLNQPTAWGMNSCTVLPDWAKPTFSDSQIAELERIQGYLIEASEDTFDSVLMLRDEFLTSIGVTDRHMHRAVRQAPPGPHQRKSGRSSLN
ncbi:MAG: hypothetical protein KGL57_06720 [Burkholderiales bacterium]|nr:hypothetical protein [Burkholderiales bacterium]